MKKTISLALALLVLSSSLLTIQILNFSLESAEASVTTDTASSATIINEDILPAEVIPHNAAFYEAQLIQVEQQLNQDPKNPILQMQENMLKKKMGKEGESLHQLAGSNFQSNATVLSYESHGGFVVSELDNDLTSEFDLLTGQRAIDESLQLDSIGSATGSDPYDQLMKDIRENIELYNYNLGSYPLSLQDFNDLDSFYSTVWWKDKDKNIADLADIIEYTLIKNVEKDDEGKQKTSFTLKLIEKKTTFHIDDISPVEIESHPWKEMLGSTEYKVPEIAEIVPADVLFINFEVPEKILELEEILLDFSETFGDLYLMGDLTEVKSKVMKRLHIPDMDQLIYGVSELAFITEDLSFDTKTDFALVLKFKNDIAKLSFSFIETDDVLSVDVGDYTVIATSKELLKRTKQAYESKSMSMSAQEDYHYMMTVLEERRDSSIYLSESFIRKLTGPTYRINAQRRNVIIEALEVLQYSVFAYRAIEGNWPESFPAMSDEGFIDYDTIYESQKYSINENGQVYHADWGSLWDIKPVNQVPITKISYAEKTNYESFSEDYQGVFRTFFDPIGIAITVSDQVMFHTVILPLIDESEYNWLKIITGEKDGVFKFFADPDPVGVINFGSKFSLDDILVEFVSQMGFDVAERGGAWKRAYTPEEEKKVNIMVAEAQIAESFELDADFVKEIDALFDITNEGSNYSPEAMLEIANNYDRLLDFVGDEIILGIDDWSFNQAKNDDDINVWLRVSLSDKEKAQKFMNRLEKNDNNTVDSLNKEYKGIEYYKLNLGFFSFYFVFIDDALYFTVYEQSINELIDFEQSEQPETFSTSELRGLDFIGLDHHMMGTINLKNFIDFSYSSDFIIRSDYNISYQFEKQRAYMNELLTLAKLLPDYDGTLGNISDYIHTIPVDFMGLEFVIENDTIYLMNGEEKINIEIINDSSRNKYSSFAGVDEGKELTTVDLLDIVDKEAFSEQLTDSIKAFRSLALGASFTEDGFDVHIAFGNPLIEEDEIVTDDRFEAIYTEVAVSSDLSLWQYILVGGLVLVLLLLVLKRIIHGEKGKNQQSVHIYHGMKFHPDNDGMQEGDQDQNSDSIYEQKINHADVLRDVRGNVIGESTEEPTEEQDNILDKSVDNIVSDVAENSNDNSDYDSDDDNTDQPKIRGSILK